MLYLAIDQHRKQLTVNLRNQAGDVLLRRQVSTQWGLVRKFFADLAERSRCEGGYVVILEVCGFNDWLLALIRESDCRRVLLVQPEKRSRHKTDRRDAGQLGEILWTNRRRLLSSKKVQGVRVIEPASRQDNEARQLTALRLRASRRRTQAINGVQHMLLKHNLQQECPTKGIQTKRARAWLAKLSLPPIDRLELDHLLQQWELCERELRALDEQIAALQAQHSQAVILATLPGGAAFSSLALASRVGTIGRFPTAGSLANYWGLTPACRNSGETTDRLGSITKQGSALARFVLGQLVLHVLRRDPHMRRRYKAIKLRRGSKIARVAIMRQLACIIWHMLKNQQPYYLGGPGKHRLQTTHCQLMTSG
jgi:transposase